MYDPNARITILQNLSRAMIRLEQLGTTEQRAGYDDAATRARDYLRAYDCYMASTEPIHNLRVVAGDEER